MLIGYNTYLDHVCVVNPYSEIIDEDPCYFEGSKTLTKVTAHGYEMCYLDIIVSDAGLIVWDKRLDIKVNDYLC